MQACAIFQEFPDYAEAIGAALAARGVRVDELPSMPPDAMRVHVFSACDAVLAHELCEEGCSSRALDLADRLHALERG